MKITVIVNDGVRSAFCEAEFTEEFIGEILPRIIENISMELLLKLPDAPIGSASTADQLSRTMRESSREITVT
jgi:hypothetical protein